MRIPGFGFLAILVLAVAGCGQLPKPFQGGDEGPEASQPIIQEARGIEVEPVEGPAVPMARLIAQSVADALVDRDIAATANGVGSSHYVLKSKARTNRQEGSPVIVYLDWTLMDREGGVVGTHTEGVQGSWWEWVNGDPKIIRKVGLGTAEAVTAMMRPSEEPVAAEPAPRALLVRQVTGAPGDGNESLTKAIRMALQGGDVPVAETADQAMAVLKGVVEMAPADTHGQQIVRIDWQVDRLDGTKLGDAHQENAVPAGSLDGPWGRVAGLAATAAVDGIKQILANAEEAELKGPGLEPPPGMAVETASRPAPQVASAPASPPPVTKPAPQPVAKVAPNVKSTLPAPMTGDFRIQLAALRSPERVDTAWKRFKREHPRVLGPLRLNIEKVDLGPQRGVFYRLQAGPFTTQTKAKAACVNLERAGLTCLPVRAK